MRKIFFFTMIMLTACLSLSCSKSSDHETENASYYVKYESKNTTRYSGDVSQVTVNTDKGSQTLICGREYSETFGPVKKGFAASITCDNKAYSNTSITVKIYVSKESGPFSLKAEVSGKESASASYSIDF